MTTATNGVVAQDLCAMVVDVPYPLKYALTHGGAEVVEEHRSNEACRRTLVVLDAEERADRASKMLAGDPLRVSDSQYLHLLTVARKVLRSDAVLRKGFLYDDDPAGWCLPELLRDAVRMRAVCLEFEGNAKAAVELRSACDVHLRETEYSGKYELTPSPVDPSYRFQLLRQGANEALTPSSSNRASGSATPGSSAIVSPAGGLASEALECSARCFLRASMASAVANKPHTVAEILGLRMTSMVESKLRDLFRQSMAPSHITSFRDLVQSRTQAEQTGAPSCFGGVLAAGEFLSVFCDMTASVVARVVCPTKVRLRSGIYLGALPLRDVVVVTRSVASASLLEMSHKSSFAVSSTTAICPLSDSLLPSQRTQLVGKLAALKTQSSAGREWKQVFTEGYSVALTTTSDPSDACALLSNYLAGVQSRQPENPPHANLTTSFSLDSAGDEVKVFLVTMTATNLLWLLFGHRVALTFPPDAETQSKLTADVGSLEAKQITKRTRMDDDDGSDFSQRRANVEESRGGAGSSALTQNVIRVATSHVGVDEVLQRTEAVVIQLLIQSPSTLRELLHSPMLETAKSRLTNVEASVRDILRRVAEFRGGKYHLRH